MSQDRTFHSSLAFPPIGKCQTYRLLRSLRRLGTPRTCTSLHRVRMPCVFVDSISTTEWDIWHPSTAPPTALFPTSDPRCVSSLYRHAIFVHAALPGTYGGTSATITSERHSSVTFENLSRKWNIGLEHQRMQIWGLYIFFVNNMSFHLPNISVGLSTNFVEI